VLQTPLRRNSLIDSLTHSLTVAGCNQVRVLEMNIRFHIGYMQIVGIPTNSAPFFPNIYGALAGAPLIYTESSCVAYPSDQNFRGAIVLAYRGGCTIATKMQMAESAGAAGLIIIAVSDDLPTYLLFETPVKATIPLGMIGATDGDNIMWNLALNDV
jgi:hypothetical protein